MIAIVAILFFVVPLLAAGVVQWMKPGSRWLHLLLSFGGAFLLAVVFLHMLPELYEHAHLHIGYFILGGFLLQVLLEYLSRGIEHGHAHLPAGGGTLPFAVMFSLGIHSFLEGMPFAHKEVSGDLPFLMGVLLHKVPMAITLATVLSRAGMRKATAWTYILAFAAAAPLGIVAGVMAGNAMGGEVLQRLLGIAIGMLLHIGTTIIFESAPEHRMDRARSLAVLAGAAIGALSVMH